MKPAISEENLKKAVTHFMKRRGLEKSICASCANLAFSRCGYGPYCLVERRKSADYLTVEPKKCDTYRVGGEIKRFS